VKFIDFVLQLLVIGLQAYAMILPLELYNLVIGICLCIAFHNSLCDLYSGYWCRPSNDVVRLLKMWMWYGFLSEELRYWRRETKMSLY